MADVLPKTDTVSASPIEIDATAALAPGQPRKQNRLGRRAAVFGVALLAALALIGWLGAAKHRARSVASTTFPAPSPAAETSRPLQFAAALDAEHAVATTLDAAPESPDTDLAPRAEAEAPRLPTGLSPSPEPAAKPTAGTVHTAKRRAHAMHVAAKAPLPSHGTKKRAKVAAPWRAGELSPDDF
jgi:hypothetical protein